MIRKKSGSKVMDMVEEELLTGRKYRDNSRLIEEFYTLEFPEPKRHSAKDIQRIRRKYKLSQSKFASLIRAKLTTLQKWERGVNEPNRYADFILEIIERKGIDVLLFN
jgi:DNA-binding transcriptional regulator YiaG